MSGSGSSAKTASWVEDYIRAWDAHDVDGVLGFMTDNADCTDSSFGETHVGTADIREFVSSLESDFSSDYRYRLGRSVADQDIYAIEWTMTGTNDRADDARGLPATGRPFGISGVSIGSLRDGKIAENTDYWNLAGLLKQVGLITAPEAAPVDG
jgi:steroid delta-isomerase-like uncharacterized protein